MVLCSQIERDVFSASTSTQAQQQSNAAAAAAASDSTLRSDDDAHGESKVRARLEPAEQREEARRAARRLIAFGFRSQGVMDEQREVEAVQENGGRIVETSFAKGEWGLRWK
ncbi:hypothetical protein I316_02691 [Kwoniella heveanensis BCC8398]|uniref:Uncharacterized protein n=1 Tax=Kwoniella heveanensis BCC8398 TaxID=1296120 RepID=A0A1B9GX82_9TREE|nr:hypothetical protein I316_02691 [Kwoniella heveanensis BCC8398]